MFCEFINNVENENQGPTKYWKRLKKFLKKELVMITLTVYNDCG